MLHQVHKTVKKSTKFAVVLRQSKAATKTENRRYYEKMNQGR